MSRNESEPSIDIESQKQQYEDNIMKQIDELYPKHLRTVVAIEIGVNIVSCGEGLRDEQLQPVLNGLGKIKSSLGDQAEKAFTGLTILMVDGIVSGGGQALGRKNAVIIDTNKTTMTITEMEDMLDQTGDYRIGDRSKLVDNPDEISATTLDVVHELGHILEFRVHGDYDVGFAGVDPSESPTAYGSKQTREDYAESWLYLVYDSPLDEQRQRILLSDLEIASQTSGVSP